ncbi:uncharacterized protein [Dermacentor albipictus]|uniref:uncharacterized protein isoform X1 n=2 Tax=Dermacentor albipictus TaxID=60249 RepID=UPI0038FC9C38
MMPKDLTPRQSSNGSVCKMGPRSGRLRVSAQCLVGSCPSVCRSVNQLFSNLRSVRSILGHHRVDLDKSCTTSAVDACFNLAQLTLWNNFLWVVIIELREGRLALACLRGRVVPVAFGKQRRRSFILVNWSLMERHSIEFVELCESRMSPKQFRLRDGLELSEHLRHARLYYHLLDYPTSDLIDVLCCTVTTLDALEIVGVSILRELLDRCDAMRTLVCHEN